MKQYKVLKDLINAPVGIIIAESKIHGTLYNDFIPILHENHIQEAIDQNFIEPYTPEPKHWRAEKGNEFYVISEFGDVYRRVDYYNADCDDLYYKSNNYYRAYTTAELVAKAKKLMLEWLHDTKADEVAVGHFYGLMKKLSLAMDEARKAVLEDDGNEE